MDDRAALMRRWFFWFFIVSGFCGLVYQVVWLRLAMAQFGVTTPMVSIVLSVFMGGLALGSFASGWMVKRLDGRSPVVFLALYALVELVIASSALVVPKGLALGGAWLMGGTAWGSLGHYAVAGAFVVALLLPFTASMGATYPFAMAALRRLAGGDARSFSRLYLANVVGATLGTLGSAFVLIEVLGFKGTLAVAAGLNASLAVAALTLAFVWGSLKATEAADEPEQAAPSLTAGPWRKGLLAMLFTTGLVSMGLEVVWTRQFTPYVGTEVYAFAGILAVYLVATFAGSAAYRTWSRLHALDGLSLPLLWMLGGALALLALVGSDPRLVPSSWGFMRVLLGVAPFSALLGFLTPLLVDRCAQGDGGRAGVAYAVNVVGCVLGPLLAGFWLLPAIGERWSLVVFALMLMAMALVQAAATNGRAAWRPLGALAALSAVVVGLTRDFESGFVHQVLKRDYTATVIGIGGDPRHKTLLVNGIGMTGLSPMTKMMTHLPLAYRKAPARNGLVICFGAGTAYRSMLSWGISSTVVELVPSVPELFGFFHADGAALKQSPLGRIVIDDGRRFLHASSEQYDVITMDPPPPVPAAGTSMLYSREFYRLVKARLRPDGVFQQWVPYGDDATRSSFTRALAEAFPHIRTFTSIEGWGTHYICSMAPLPERSAAELAAQLPPAAAKDLVEWGPTATPEGQFARVLAQPVDWKQIVALSQRAPVLEDDRPINEYYFIRSKLARLMLR